MTHDKPERRVLHKQKILTLCPLTRSIKASPYKETPQAGIPWELCFIVNNRIMAFFDSSWLSVFFSLSPFATHSFDFRLDRQAFREEMWSALCFSRAHQEVQWWTKRGRQAHQWHGYPPGPGGRCWGQRQYKREGWCCGAMGHRACQIFGDGIKEWGRTQR